MYFLLIMIIFALTANTVNKSMKFKIGVLHQANIKHFITEMRIH